jgi:hypothetical protein
MDANTRERAKPAALPSAIERGQALIDRATLIRIFPVLDSVIANGGPSGSEKSTDQR